MYLLIRIKLTIFSANIHCWSVFRRYDVLSLHQDRPDDVRPRGRLDPPYESVFRNTTRKAGAHRRVRDAGYILQLRVEPAHGKVHGEGEVIRALRDEHLRDHRRRVHRGWSDRFAALSFSACDTEEDRVREVQLNTSGPDAASLIITDPNSCWYDRVKNRPWKCIFSKQAKWIAENGLGLMLTVDATQANN